MRLNINLQSFSYNLDGTRVLVSDDKGTIRLLDAETGDVIATKQIQEAAETNVKYLKSGKSIAVATYYDESKSVISLDLPQ